MNWYKISQEYAPIAIISYNNYQELGIAFNGGTKYVYEEISVKDEYLLEAIQCRLHELDKYLILKPTLDNEKRDIAVRKVVAKERIRLEDLYISVFNRNERIISITNNVLGSLSPQLNKNDLHSHILH